MNITEKHSFYITSVDDDILDSIDKYGQNIEKLDGVIDNVVPNLNIYLQEGKTYSSGQKVWNAVPSIGDYVGWVNIRTGVYAPNWTRNTKYKVGDLVFPTTNNGHYYQCITEGTSAYLEPTFLTASGSEIEDLSNVTFWTASTVYKIGDIVRKVAGDKNYFYQCVVAGTTGATEPSWTDIEGVTIPDGSVSWYVYKTVKWKEVGISCEFRNFGKIY